MNLEWWISWRYLITKRKEKFLSLISIISILGVVVGVAALIVVIAVMTGFDQDLRDKIVGNFSHLTITADSGIDNPEELIHRLKSLPRVRGASPFVYGQVLISTKERIFAIGLRGIEPESVSGVSKIKDYLIKGDLSRLNSDGVIVGKELANLLWLDVGKNLTVQAPSGEIYELSVEGIFNSGMYDYDTNLIFLNLDKAKEILGLHNVSGIALNLDNLDKAEVVKRSIQNLLGLNFTVKTWMELNATFFAALRLEKITMFIILTLIVLVAAFNIASTLIVTVVEKTKDIGILKSIGMSGRQIRRIFTYQGLTIGILGVFFGMFCGWLLCFLLKKYQFIRLPADIYYLDHLPVSLQLWPDVIFIVVAALLITVFSTIYPAVYAGRLRPVEALRYE